MNRIYEIWAILEEKNQQTFGLNKVRYSESSHSDLYLGVKHPENQRLLLLRSDAAEPDLPGNRDFKGLRLEKIYDTSVPGKIFLSLILTDRTFTGIFDTIVQDIAFAVEENLSFPAIRVFTERLEKWHAIFEQFAPSGLSESAQCGLYGELALLYKLLLHAQDRAQVVRSWTGPRRTVHDFQYGPCSIEVKVTTGNNHQKIQISNERQLDSSGIPELFLYHLSLEVRQQAGETLNAIADKLNFLLEPDFVVSAKFKTLLAEAGYFEHHRKLYDDRGYILRQENFYRVGGDFPRIEEKDLRKGVGDISYSIIAAQLSPYSIPESETLRKFGTNDD